jgi:hypothetical protein
MKKITIIAIAAAVLSAHPARAETATSRAIVACENLSKLDERNTCLGRIPNCKVVLTRDFDDATQGVHWHNGKEFDIDGGSEDLGNYASTWVAASRYRPSGSKRLVCSYPKNP